MPPRQRINLAREVGQYRATTIINAKCNDDDREIDPDTDCWLFKGSKNTSGYGQAWSKKNSDMHKTGRDAQTAFLLHRLAYLSANGVDLQDDGSHLCARPACFNPAHIADETSALNDSRKGCPGPIYCSAHGHLIIDLCTHQPPCIRGPRSDVMCCLALKESDPTGWASQEREKSVATSVSGSFSIDTDLMEGAEDEGSQEFEGVRELEAAFASGEVKMPPVYETLDQVEDDE